MKKLQWTAATPLAAGTAIALLLPGCNTTRTAKAPASPQDFQKPLVAEKPPAPNKEVLPLVTAAAKLPTVNSDRDPFAAVPPSTALKFATEPIQPTTNTVQPAQPTPSSDGPTAIIGPFPRATASSKPNPRPVATARATAPKALPKPTVMKLPTVPASAPMAALPPLTVPSVAPMSPLPIPVPVPNMADSIAITGVLQVGGKLTAIVQEPNASPRYVQAGAVLAGGKVRLKRIVLNGNGEPTIILEENGREVIKSLGSVVAQGL